MDYTHCNFKKRCDECGKLRFKDDLVKLSTSAKYAVGGKSITIKNSKTVCYDGCIFQLKCGCYHRQDPYDLEDKYADFYCYKCNWIEKIRLKWEGPSNLKWINQNLIS